ncbi:hypothetical protein TROLL_159 [Bacillus phage Troll]|uniref:Uncharacterized protein n=2 Tax=Bequatrovirus troll TaxID=1918009 RepID=A0A7U3TSY4_9CAUD|nr:hypothetical protein TROLL_159 [Bacillus phage Troll]YP_009290033.1 hypothetical protein BI003_gp154 [Bacillus phage Phrodo]QPY77389.1 hypothetical protein ANTHOS_153 [Bacillus phage Anthos]ULF48777.1 hypothetical protein [Bacillus phage BillyBob]AGT13515.1 hypothetical protein TROLL_159 [Bacillus phage Troll]AMW62195.1 hypothetical protein PHRODO_154 [Bacillus phage Phrodo]
METGRVYYEGDFEYKWNGICYVYRHKNEFDWGLVRTTSFHMEVIKQLEHDYHEEDIF